MLEHERRPLSSDRFPSALEEAAPQPGPPVAVPPRRRRGPIELAASVVRWSAVQSRLVVGLVLVAGAVVWAIARGLSYYGLSPIHLAYDLDQPPWLLLLVSGWLWYRSRRR
jgi:hypothetical protein